MGRVCTRYGEGEWYPTPEPDEVRALRAEFALDSDSLQRLIPGDPWVLGQRVWTHAEGGDWEGALLTSRDCGGAQPWWCSALEGLSLHGLGRHAEAEGAFEHALAEMDPEAALEWRVPERAVDPDAREILATMVTAADGFLDVVLDRMWSLADPCTWSTATTG